MLVEFCVAFLYCFLPRQLRDYILTFFSYKSFIDFVVFMLCTEGFESVVSAGSGAISNK